MVVGMGYASLLLGATPTQLMGRSFQPTLECSMVRSLSGDATYGRDSTRHHLENRSPLLTSLAALRVFSAATHTIRVVSGRRQAVAGSG
jgi:hypothetical protein